METTRCPECGKVAEVLWRADLDSSDGPVEHAKVQCVDRHWFLLPTENLSAGIREAAADEAAGVQPVGAGASPSAR